MKNVAILILNWNNLYDSLSCLESLLSLEYENYKIIFIDNGSTDGSFEGILEFLKEKGIPFLVVENSYQYNINGYIDITKVFIIRNTDNFGYTGGFNTGLRFVLEFGRFDYIWILNNDTVVERSALNKLVDCFERQKAKGVKVGAAGTTLLYPNGKLQAVCGCRLVKVIGNSSFLTKKVQHLDYIVGASLFLDMDALKNVYLFDERFFLYWDDADYSIRLKKAGYELICCDDVIVYHKEGGTAGRIEKLNDYYWVRNGLLFTWKHQPYFLPLTIFAYIFKYVVIRTFKRQPNNISALLFGIYHFLTGKFGKKP